VQHSPFEPKFKLLIAGNHRPGLRNVDEAIRRRFNLIPFAVKIPADQRDKDLPEKLKAEWPGILAWAIDGCLDWQKIGLAPPPAVVVATDDYLRAEDALSLWLDECCLLGDALQYGCSPLFSSWKTWADAAGEHAGSQKRFSQAMQARGHESVRQSGGAAALRGVGLKAAPASPRYGE